jgi:type VI secretion system protein ImpH
MARPHRLQNAAVEDRLRAQPRWFAFFQAVRLIEGRSRARRQPREPDALVGEEASPQQQVVAFRAAPHLSYPAAEIDELVDRRPQRPEMTVNFIGLTGPAGVLPQHYSVTLMRELRRRNTALRDFFDIFNNRLIGFFYRAWTKYRVPISVERGGADGGDGATKTMQALIGFGTDHLAGLSEIPQHSLLHYSGLFANFRRNGVSLQQLLCDYFELPIRIEAFHGRWLALPAAQRSVLGPRGRFVGLGLDAMIGDSYFDVQGCFLIVVGPVGYALFAQFMPDGDKLRRLAALTRLYVDPQLGFRVELALARDEIPGLHLARDAAAPPQLGWNTWLRHYPATEDARDAGWYL